MTETFPPSTSDTPQLPTQSPAEQNVSQKFLDEVHAMCKPDFSKAAATYITDAAIYGVAGGAIGSAAEPGLGTAIGAGVMIGVGISAADTSLEKDAKDCEDAKINKQLNDEIDALRGKSQ